MKVIKIIHLGDNKNCNKEWMLILSYVLFPTLRIFHLKLLETVWSKCVSAKMKIMNAFKHHVKYLSKSGARKGKCSGQSYLGSGRGNKQEN